MTFIHNISWIWISNEFITTPTTTPTTKNKILLNKIGYYRLNRTLRTSLQLLRRKGSSIRMNSGSLDRPIIESNSSCARCRLVFGYINRGAECYSCHMRVCRDCRIDIPHTNNNWVCIICFKEMWVLCYCIVVCLTFFFLVLKRIMKNRSNFVYSLWILHRNRFIWPNEYSVFVDKWFEINYSIYLKI